MMPAPDSRSDNLGGGIDWLEPGRGTRIIREFIGMSDGPGAPVIQLSALSTDFPTLQLRKLPLERTGQTKIVELRKRADILGIHNAVIVQVCRVTASISVRRNRSQRNVPVCGQSVANPNDRHAPVAKRGRASIDRVSQA